jgi:hypothetical protein
VLQIKTGTFQNHSSYQIVNVDVSTSIATKSLNVCWKEVYKHAMISKHLEGCE